MEARLVSRGTTDRTGFVVRVRGIGEESAGVGVVVGDRHIITCAHVVNVALGRRKTERQRPVPAVRLQVDFPLLGDAEGAPIRICRLKVWEPPPADGEPGRYLAGLEIVSGEPLPPGAGPAHLLPLTELQGTEVSLFGYPGSPPRKAGGGWSQCRLRGPVGGGLVQFDVDSTAALRAQPGYSGSPVIVAQERGDAVLGLLSLASVDGRMGDAYAIPASQFVETWPEVLADSILPACPYRGLQAFTEADAAAGIFVGREEELAQLRQMAHHEPAVLVVGPSGVGKTSLVAAGLVPALRHEDWLVAAFRPGPEPFASMARAVLEIERPDGHPSLSDLDRCTAYLREHGVWEVGRRLTVLRRRPVAMICDQLEEMLAFAGPGGHSSDLFLDLLLPPLGAPAAAGQFLVVATVRSDFLPALLDQPGLGPRLQGRQLNLSPLSVPALTRVVVEPARLMDVTFAQGLPEMIAREAGPGRGGLPLLEFMLAELWPMQRRRRISFDDYHAIGGVAGALDRHAERAFNDLRTTFTEDRVRRVLLRMIRTRGSAAEAVRTVVSREQMGADWEVAVALARPEQRLVVLGRDTSGAQVGTAEIAHEALIREWHRLAGWVESDTKFQRWLAVMEERASESELLSDDRIAEAQIWLASRPHDVPEAVVRLVARSRSMLQQRLDELAEARRASEEYFRAIVQHTRDPILILDDNNQIRYANPAAGRFFDNADLSGTVLPDLVAPSDQLVAAQLLQLIRAGNASSTTMDWRLPDAQGQVRIVEATGADLRREPAVRALMVTLHDTTASRRREAELAAQRATDSLTGLPNRVAMQEWLAPAPVGGTSTTRAVAVIVLDFDGFKIINDMYGHAAADGILIEVGRRLGEVCPHGLARLGGDEFAVVVENVNDMADLESLAEQLIAAR